MKIYLKKLRVADTLLTNIIDELLKEEEIERQLAANKEFLNSKKIFRFVEEGLQNLGSNITKTDRNKKRKKHRKCDCLPSCTSLKYNIETSQTDYEWVKRADGLLLLNDYEIDQRYFCVLPNWHKELIPLLTFLSATCPS